MLTECRNCRRSVRLYISTGRTQRRIRDCFRCGYPVPALDKCRNEAIEDELGVPVRRPVDLEWLAREVLAREIAELDVKTNRTAALREAANDGIRVAFELWTPEMCPMPFKDFAGQCVREAIQTRLGLTLPRIAEEYAEYKWNHEEIESNCLALACV